MAKEKKERKHIRFPITVKTIIMIVLFGSILAEIVMVDLNYLKMINDDYGHDNGDEFVVIVKNNDYKHVKELFEVFNYKIDELWEDKELPLYERTSAAIGYAIYDPSIHKSATDVFIDADRAMYKRKWEMKSHNW